jgi:radical SAM protein with 4Fe4S-binding SPASM domain
MHSKEPATFILPLFRTPQILPRILRAIYTKHVRAPREYRRGDGCSRIPIQLVSIKITNSCNLRCRTCAQWGETGYNFNRPTTETQQIVPVETYLQLTDRLAKYRPLYYIWGGEPFLYPDVMKLTARIKQNQSLLAVVTNATFLKKNARTVVDQGWDALMFSLDGPENVHDEIRGRKHTFKKVAAGIRAVRKHKADTGKTLPWLMPLITVSAWNANRLDEIIQVVSQLGADCAVVYYSWFTNEAVGKSHSRIFEERLGITPTAWRGFLFNHKVDTEALKASLNRIRQQRYHFPILYIPDLGEDQLERYYRDPADFLGYGPCISPWTTVEILPNGDVTPCRDYSDFVAGNILKLPIEEIWNGRRYVKFRKTLFENGGTFPICARCCGLMGW